MHFHTDLRPVYNNEGGSCEDNPRANIHEQGSTREKGRHGVKATHQVSPSGYRRLSELHFTCMTALGSDPKYTQQNSTDTAEGEVDQIFSFGQALSIQDVSFTHLYCHNGKRGNGET